MLDRRDFGVVYPGMPDDPIEDQVVLHVMLAASVRRDERRMAAARRLTSGR